MNVKVFTMCLLVTYFKL